ncbi:AfsR/SARP family transcriptional regulator [Streptomyces tauricus]|uniref:AfsR/SARP family transcriptional regulator n=1 Tax=Streptomyces tauricus TaxID=68274 RepID=UPI00224366C8|nr:BTAD domain-containing putative transcriptional regulator [Streptomyces tauricus]MCW8101755.1 BTAD domain-containing putative transcriptional regulator [Streptomyces tauricus]
MEERLRFSVLGPVGAWRGEVEVELGPPQQRSVLAVLLLAEGSQVPASGLVDAVWGSAAPASAVNILRGYVHRLRKSLEPGENASSSVIRSTGDGYQLRVSPDELDLSVFRELLLLAEGARGAGDTEGVVKYLRDALGLWRGVALAGVRGGYAQNQRQRLGELRLSAQATRLTAELDLGAHTQAVTELVGLVAEYPLDERLRELLMLALYRSGRQAAALAVYREAQTLLADELGVDPGPALQAMYQRVIRSDAGLLTPPAPTEPENASVQAVAPVPVRAPTVTVPAQLPAGLATFVGRDAELTQVARLPSAGAVVISAIAGMAGVGKTTFAVHWARQVADRFPDGQLYLNLRGFDPVGLPVPPEHALRSLLESLGADAHGLPQDVDALAARYRTLLTGKRALLLLDNARDAAQVRPLLPGAPGCLVIVTSRNRLAGLVAVDGAHPLHLDVLSPSEARELLARRLGQQRVTAEPDAVQEIITRCARLPLALAITAARAATRSAIPLASIAAELRDSADGLDAFHDGDTAADARAVFSWSYHALTPDAARLFRLLALHPGPDVTLPAATSLAGLTVPRARQLLGELIQAHLVDEAVPGRYLSHDLLRAYATELIETVESPQQVRAARHRMFDHYLHTAHEAAALTTSRALISLAPAAEGVRAEKFAEDAGKATAWFTAEQAVMLAALEEAASRRYDVHTWQLAWAIGHHLHLHGLWREQEAVHRAAMDAACRLGDRTAQAHVHNGLTLALGNLDRLDEARSHAERAVELFTESRDTRAYADSYYNLAWVGVRQGDPEAALGAVQQSLALFRACDNCHGGDDGRGQRAIATALNAVGWCHTLLGQHQQALDHCRQALTLQQELGHDAGTADTWDSIGHALHHLGQYDEAVAAYRNALALYRQLDASRVKAATLMHLGDTHLSAGHPDTARAAWTEALDAMDRLSDAEHLAEPLRNRLRRLDEQSGPPETDAELTGPCA